MYNPLRYLSLILQKTYFLKNSPCHESGETAAGINTTKQTN